MTDGITIQSSDRLHEVCLATVRLSNGDPCDRVADLRVRIHSFALNDRIFFDGYSIGEMVALAEKIARASGGEHS